MAVPMGYMNPRMQAMPLKGPQYAGDTPPIIANPGAPYGGPQTLTQPQPGTVQALGGAMPQQPAANPLPANAANPAVTQMQTMQQTRPAMPAGQTPQYGLAGAESALSGGLGQFQNIARQTLGGALGALEQGQAQGRGDLMASIAMSQGGIRSALADLTGGAPSASAGDFSNAGVNEAINQGVGAFSPYMQHGGAAYQQQAALSGALGPEAQKAAFARFTESPGQAFLREQAERGLLRNQAAIGGLGGGRVMQELQRQAMGLAAQDFDNQFNRLGQVTGTGMQAAGQVGQLRGQQAGLAQGLNIARGQAGTQANIANAQMAQQQQQMRAGLWETGANLAARLGETMAGQSFQGGQNRAGYIGNVGQALGGATMDVAGNLANLRTRAGEQIAGNVAGTSGNIAQMLANQGLNMSQLVGSGAGNIAQLLQGYGQESALSQQQLAAILANLATGQGSQVAGLPSAAGLYQTPNYMGMTSNLLGGIGNVITAMNQGSAPAGNTPGIVNAFPRSGY